MPTAAELKDQITDRLAKARDIAAQAETDNRDFTDTERGQLAGWINEAKTLKADLLKAEGDVDLRNQLTALGVGMIDSQGGTTTPRPTPIGDPTRVQNQTIGQAFLNSAEYKEFLVRYAVGGTIPDSVKGLQSRPAIFNSLLTGESSTSAGAFVVTDRKDIVVPNLRRPLTIKDIITNGTTTSDTVEFVRVTSETNAAAPVAEATASAGSSGVKPESAMAMEIVTETVKTIAHWIPATKRALSDAGQLRTLIDDFLRFGLEEELEDQIMTGSGTGQNFTGIDNTTNVQTQAYDTNLLTTTRKAKTLVSTVGRDTPTAYVLHPNDWEDIDLLQDNEARYFFGGPTQAGIPILWGLPVVQSEATTEGKGWVGNFREAVLWDREQASITISDSHADFFIRNLIAILAEMRAAFGVLRPRSFVEIDLTP